MTKAIFFGYATFIAFLALRDIYMNQGSLFIAEAFACALCVFIAIRGIK